MQRTGRDRKKSAQRHIGVYFYLEPGLENVQGLPHFKGSIRVQENCHDALRKFMKGKKDGFCFRMVLEKHGPPGGIAQGRVHHGEQILEYDPRYDTNEGLAKHLIPWHPGQPGTRGPPLALSSEKAFVHIPVTQETEVLNLPSSLDDDGIGSQAEYSRSTDALDHMFTELRGLYPGQGEEEVVISSGRVYADIPVECLQTHPPPPLKRQRTILELDSPPSPPLSDKSLSCSPVSSSPPSAYVSDDSDCEEW